MPPVNVEGRMNFWQICVASTSPWSNASCTLLYASARRLSWFWWMKFKQFSLAQAYPSTINYYNMGPAWKMCFSWCRWNMHAWYWVMEIRFNPPHPCTTSLSGSRFSRENSLHYCYSKSQLKVYWDANRCNHLERTIVVHKKIGGMEDLDLL